MDMALPGHGQRGKWGARRAKGKGKGRRGKCWQLLSAFCICSAGRLETAPAACRATRLMTPDADPSPSAPVHATLWPRRNVIQYAMPC